MSGRWFRFYESALDDPKVQQLPGELFKAWVNILCAASRGDGFLPDRAGLSFMLRKSEKATDEIIAKLAAAGLLDITEDGPTPHNWRGRQFLTDSSTDRVQKYREKRRANGLPILGDYSKFKAALVERDGEMCVYCEATGKLVVDHMVPITLGGTDAEDNLALACKPCNSGKAGRTPELANMTIRVTTAARALARYRDAQPDVTVSETSSEQNRAEDRTEQKESERATRSGARLPDDWQPSAEDRAFTGDFDIDVEATASVFRDYWHGVAGAKGRKADWAGTWRNWIRREVESRKQRPSVSTKPNGSNGSVPTRPDDGSEWAARLRSYRPGGFWSQMWGERPEDIPEGRTPTHIPAPVLAAWRASA